MQSFPNVVVELGLRRKIETIGLTPQELIAGSVRLTHASIQSVERKPRIPQGYPVIVASRAFLILKIYFRSEAEAATMTGLLQKLINISFLEQLPAFSFICDFPRCRDIAAIYNHEKEFRRLGVATRTNKWRFSKINEDFEFCPTYPRVLVVPEKISDNVLRHTGKFRSKCRIPSLSYLHRTNNVTITRSSQPMVGLNKNRSIQDEKLIEAIFQSGLVPPASGYSNLIIDARPTANALAQTAMGAGTESAEIYGAKVIFLGIENIHVVRDSMNKLMDVVLNAADLSNVSSALIDKSGWLRHIRSILDGALIIIQHVHMYNCHVLIHCSDGWDRTAQLSSLAQICLDPYYRTFEGLQVLIEKEWCQFGHKFKDRCGHLSREDASLKTKIHSAGKTMSNSISSFFGSGINPGFISQANNLSSSEMSTVSNLTPKEVSPIFVQFLDALSQIIRQFPDRFEYNEKILLLLVTHTYSCQFKDFLFNNQKEKADFFSKKSANDEASIPSVWEFVVSNKDVFQNTSFINTCAQKTQGHLYSVERDEVLLLPSTTSLQPWSVELLLTGGAHNSNFDADLSELLENSRRLFSYGNIEKALDMEELGIHDERI